VKAYRATNPAVLAVLPISVGGQSGMVSSAMVSAKGKQAESHVRIRSGSISLLFGSCLSV
jgi:hypothetical protein